MSRGGRAASAALLLCACAAAALAEPHQSIATAQQQLAANNCRGAVQTLKDAMPEASVIAADKERNDAMAALHFYTALAFSNCKDVENAKEHLRDFFRLHPGQSKLDEAKYGRPFVRLFDEVQRTLTTGEMFERFYPGFDERAGSPEETIAIEIWSTSPAFQLLAEDQEREEWGRLRDDAARSAFIERFWKRRDTDPQTGVNEYRGMIAQRVAFADRSFPVANELRGSMSDRGRVFVLLGAPARIHRSALQRFETTIVAQRVRTPLTGTLERWIYFKPQLSNVAAQQVEFRFITQLGYGEYVMQRDFWPLKALAQARLVRSAGPDAP